MRTGEQHVGNRCTGVPSPRRTSSAWRCSREGLVRYLVLFVIDLKTRRVHVAGVTSQADGAWMAQVARNLTDAAAGPLTGFGHFIVDRDIPFPSRDSASSVGCIGRRERLGGVLSFYERNAA